MRLSAIIDWLKKQPAAIALLLLLVANGLLIAFDPICKVDPDSLPAVHSWVWWAAQDFRNQKPAPNLVLLGSSVMMDPVWFQEADYRQGNVDLAVDHRSRYLESVINRYTGTKQAINCFSFALPGAMASDACMVARAMFKDDRKPGVAVLMLHPRDLADARFNCAASSKHFKYLSRFTDTSDLVELSMPHLWQRISYWWQQAVYLKGKRQDLQVIGSEKMRQSLAPFLSTLPPSPLDSGAGTDQRYAVYATEIEKGMWVAHPNVADAFIDVSFDCKNRLGTLNDPLFENQAKWLDLYLSTLHEQGVAPVIVNAPLTDTARKLMAPGMQARHTQLLQSLSKKWHCAYFDADIRGLYAANDYTDWAHMDASGGRKLLDSLGRYLAGNPDITRKLAVPQSAGERLAGRSATSL